MIGHSCTTYTNKNYTSYTTIYTSYAILTVEANIDPPNHTAYLCIGCDITLTSIGAGVGATAVGLVADRASNRDRFTCMRPSTYTNINQK